ncbi:Probable NADH dehydrogenase [ubiquinone] 1 alpha subcomplex subunit 5, mitochondrial [Linum perenne]
MYTYLSTCTKVHSHFLCTCTHICNVRTLFVHVHTLCTHARTRYIRVHNIFTFLCTSVRLFVQVYTYSYTCTPTFYTSVHGGSSASTSSSTLLIGLYNKTLNEILALPADDGYRKAVESFTGHEMKVCQEEDWEEIEKKLGYDHVEELIEEAQDELKLIHKIIDVL